MKKWRIAYCLCLHREGRKDKEMTIQFLAKKIAPDFSVKIQDEKGIIEERLAGDISASNDSFYQSKVGDWATWLQAAKEQEAFCDEDGCQVNPVRWAI